MKKFKIFLAFFAVAVVADIVGDIMREAKLHRLLRQNELPGYPEDFHTGFAV